MRLICCILLFAALAVSSCKSGGSNSAEKGAVVNTDTTAQGERAWWKEAVVYQIYPRSFKDSDGDGVGDLKGLISKLDYLKSLGITAVWLNPIYSSPNFDNGYDVSDYRNIMKDFGTMADFDVLLKGMHDRGIKVVMDLVVNHSSNEHEWFKQSRSSRTNPYRDYYHWWPAEKGKPTYRWSFFDVNSDAWKYDTLTNSYYLHYFAQQQPDLNWENPKLRHEIYDMMRYWLDKGIDGFRMDAFQFVSKDTTFPAFPEGYYKHIDKYYGGGPHLHDYLQEMNREVLSKYNIMSVAEGAGTSVEDGMKFVDADRHELNMAYHFEGIDLGYANPSKIPGVKGFTLADIKQVYSYWDSSFSKKGWLSIFLANHDQPRMVSHWGNDAPAYRELSSKLLSTFVMTMRGTPFYYYGDELGMTNARFDRIEDYQDIQTRNAYAHLKNTGGDTKGFLERQKLMSRENGRTPMQWDDSPNTGFTTGKPWLKVNPNYVTVNVAAEEKDANSPLNYFRSLVQLRKKELTLVYGKYTLLDRDNPNVYSYTREWNGRKLLVVLNFSDKNASANTGFDASKLRVLLDNYGDHGTGTALRPYESVIYEL